MLALFEFIPTKDIIKWVQDKLGVKEALSEMKSVDGGPGEQSSLL